ncbi:MAG: DUF11 domain-containing protein [Candidatus Marinimicrobia bacterium]|nr:DUF11 domain-containing protein [Candidatus Neomarinimicrobiota bacterium]MCF7851168.1 DUF11 domain-containing protein [Candidatus Neomarinimicrobiota bacterium]MCF7904248.1 DUF11 domain-containing protein [Candidatus Neomarinimicrobiota bacterium]
MLGLLWLPAKPLMALEPWPTESEWVGLLQADWTPSTDADDQNADYLDIVENGYDSYFYATETTLFFRIGLQGSPLDKKGKLSPFAWFAPIDVDGDYQPDWSIMVGGISEVVEVAYDPTGSGDPSIVTYTASDPVTTGDVRVVPAGYATYPDFVWVDVQVPFSALTASGYANNIDFGTPIRMFFLTSTSESMTIKDGTGGGLTISGALGNTTVTGGQSMGFVFDTRDPDPYTSGGSWLYNETITVSGYGWPNSSSTYYNGGSRNAYIKDSAGTTVWSGTISTDANGDITNQSTWTATGSYAGGEATIYVEHPSESPSAYYPYDTFTIAAPPSIAADLSITKTANVDSVYEGSNVTYSITITNTGAADGTITAIKDTLPAGLTYVPGSASSLTSDNPTIVGNELTWSGSWNIDNFNDPINFVTLVFSASLDASAGDNMTYSNKAGVIYSGPDTSATGETAPVKFLPPAQAGPNITVEKAANVDTVINGSNLNYTITVTNTGDTAGSITAVADSLPTGFTYVTGTSSGLTTSDPTIAGQTLTWSGSWTVNEAGNNPNFKTLSFTVTAPAAVGDYTNIASATGSNFSTVSSGATAQVYVAATPAAANMLVTKTAANDTISSGDNISYTVNILNNGGSRGNITVVVDSLPAGFTYVTGTTSGLTTSDPTIQGRKLSWSGSWSLNKNVSQTLTFTATSAIANDLFFNKAEVFGTDFTGATSGWTAPVRVLSPELSLVKSVDVVNALPGDTLTYTVSYLNIGDDQATEVIVYEIIPSNSTYVVDSATGAGMTITYSVNNGSTYDAPQSAAVTNIKFERGISLPLGGSGSIEFKVRIPDQ